MQLGAVMTSQISTGYKSPRVKGFDVTFQDGFKYFHEGGLITLPRELIKLHGRVEKAREVLE